MSDLGGGKAAHGNEAIAAIVKAPEHLAALEGGLCQFTELPQVTLNGDTVAVSYLQIITPNKAATPVAVSGHGTSSGFAPTAPVRTDGSSSGRRMAGKWCGAPCAARWLHARARSFDAELSYEELGRRGKAG